MPPSAIPPMNARDWGLLVVLSVLWGGSFFFVGVAVTGLPPFTIVFLRVSLAAAILVLVLRAGGGRLPGSRAAWAAFFGMGVLNNGVPFSLIAWGQTQIASGLASILNATTPLFTVLVAHALTGDEKLTAHRLVGVLAGFGGVAVMLGPAGTGCGALVPQLAVLAAALSYAFAGVFGRRFGRLGVPPLAASAGVLTASAAMLLPLSLIVDRPWTLAMPGPTVWGAVFGLAAGSTALAYVIYFGLLARAGATNLALVTFLIPVSAIALGVLALGEELLPRHALGFALIAAGLACLDGRLLRRRRVPPAA